MNNQTVINTTGEPINEAPVVDTTSITCFLGVYCKPISNLAKSWHISEDLLSDRLKEHIEPYVAVLTTDSLELAYVGLDGKARYTLNSNNSEYYTARELVEKYRPDLLEAYDKHNPTGEYRPRIINKEDSTNE